MSVSSNGSVGMAESLQKLHIVFPLWMFQRSDFLEHFQEVDQKFAVRVLLYYVCLYFILDTFSACSNWMACIPKSTYWKIV